MLLITSCINPNKDVPYLSIKSSSERFQQYCTTVEWAIKSTNFSKIVFVDNSNFDTTVFQKYVELATKYEKRLEILSFQGNVAQVVQKGKGYGEGEMIEYALENSSLLADSNYFYKITGRLIVENISEIEQTVKEDNYLTGCFYLNYPYTNMIDTRFYLINKELYKNILLNEYYHVDDSNWFALEHIYYKELKKNKIKYSSFKVYPRISGQSGSSGKTYNKRKIFYFYDILCKLGVFNYESIIYILDIPRKIRQKIHRLKEG
ncbi:hypothetical protein [Bacillus sp. OTU530]|uniref:hypothetical protein n=1 Tax=Bacillus sp. OTU530 TaxID=3043862 RepID=UPI00313B4A58